MLYRQRRDSIEHTLLLRLAALILFVIANTFPFMTFELEGRAELRAQLKASELLTGELLVDLDFHPESPPATRDRSGAHPTIPAMPAQLEAPAATSTLAHRL